MPKRLLWKNFENFITGGGDVPDGYETNYLYPTVDIPGAKATAQSIFDYLGIPPVHSATFKVNSLRLRAYNLIWNEWFRDENLQDKVKVNLEDSGDLYTDFNLLRRGRRHDYFSSCLPWPQKGVAVDLPLGTVAPVVTNPDNPYPRFVQDRMTPASYPADGGRNWGNGVLTAGTNSNTDDVVRSMSDSIFSNSSGAYYDVLRYALDTDTVGTSASAVSYERNSGLLADLSTATAASINEFRQAFQIQRLFERDARGGSRYVESILSHFKTRSPDARLQRPEYLGGGEIPFYVQSVAQTSATDGVTPQGNLAAVATGTDTSGSIGFTHAFSEHCIVVGLICITTDAEHIYQQGIDRFLSKSTRFDEYWPALAHLGEQAVLSREIYADGTDGDDTVFGYQERYAEYRYKPSVISGSMRSAYGSLDFWHLATAFASRPTLSADFIEEQPPFERVLAVASEAQFLLDAYFDFKASRPMPLYGVPGLIDHF